MPSPAAGRGHADPRDQARVSISRAACGSSTRCCRPRARRPTRDDLNVLRQIIINRVDKSGVAEPQVVIQGNDRVIVEMPGVQNADQIRNLVGTTGRLDFVPLGQTGRRRTAAPQRRSTRSATTRRITNCVLFSGDQIAAALDRREPGGPAHRRLHAPGTGKDLFAQYTADHIGDYFAIVLDGKVISAPVDQRARSPTARCRSARTAHRRLPAGRRAEPGHDPPVRPAAVPDPGAGQHHRQPDARRGVPAPEPGRRR